MIDVSDLVVCRVLWGDESLISHEKVKWDVSVRAADYSKKLRGRLHERCVAFGSHNADFLRSLGYADVIELEDKVPDVYSATDLPPRRKGRIVNGIHHLWHKLWGIRAAIAAGSKAAIFLDWDVVAQRKPGEDLLAILAGGPDFQGREGHSGWMKVSWRSQEPVAWRPDWRQSQMFYVGGCMYFRGLPIIDMVIDIHAKQMPGDGDELAVTWLVDNCLGKECNNRELYTNCKGMHDRHPTPFFSHGRLISIRQFNEIKAGKRRFDKGRLIAVT